jgi:hypothetical protein
LMSGKLANWLSLGATAVPAGEYQSFSRRRVVFRWINGLGGS